MIIDFHAHTFPDKIAAHALEHMQSMSHNLVYSDGTVAGLTASMKEAGITHSVVLPVVTNPGKASHINDISIAHDSADGLIYFGGIHPDTENWKQELDRMAENGLKGFKVHPYYQGADIDDIRYLRIFGRAAELGLIVVMHAGLEPAYPGQVRCSPEMTRNMLRQVPGLTLVAAHMGGLWSWEQVSRHLADTNVYLDTSNALGKMEQTPGNHWHEEDLKLLDESAFCALVRDFGAHRILFGADSPWTAQKASVEAIQKLPLTEEEKEMIFFRNAKKLLKL